MFFQELYKKFLAHTIHLGTSPADQIRGAINKESKNKIWFNISYWF